LYEKSLTSLLTEECAGLGHRHGYFIVTNHCVKTEKMKKKWGNDFFRVISGTDADMLWLSMQEAARILHNLHNLGVQDEE
jgi:hypothetical protein